MPPRPGFWLPSRLRYLLLPLCYNKSNMPLSKARNRERMRIVNTGEDSGLQPKPYKSRRKFLSINERLLLLTDIAIDGNRKLTNPVEAIKEINRMTGSYPPERHLIGQKVVFEVIYRDQLPAPVPLPVVGELIEGISPDQSVPK